MIASPIALVVAPPPGEDRIITGLRLSERAQRVAVGAGIAPADVVVVTAADELERQRAALAARIEAGAPLVLIRADGQVVARELVEPLGIASPGTRVAVDARGGTRDGELGYAGAIRADGTRAADLIAALSADLHGGDRALLGDWTDAARVEVNDRARHPAATREQARAADKWQFELVNKPLDGAMARYFNRPLARPLTRMFLRSPLSPNAISIVSSALSLSGCYVAAGPSWSAHLIGLLLLLAGGVVDCCDGEVARLRLESSNFGAWLDAIGDDLARIGLLLGIGYHIAPRYSDWPIEWITWGAVVLTVITLALIYWYCIFVAGTSNNQAYGEVLGVGPGNDEGSDRSIFQKIGDLAAQASRRDFTDPAAVVLAAVNLPVIGFVGLTAGAAAALAVVVPAHMRLVQSRRTERAG